jgi:hypothetical protein
VAKNLDHAAQPPTGRHESRQPTARSPPCYGSEYSSRRRSFLIDAHRYESFKSVKIICNSVPGLRLATDMNPTQSVPLEFRNYLASAVGAPDLCGRQVGPWFRGATLRTAFQGARELELMVRLTGTSRIDFCLCVPGHEWVAATILRNPVKVVRSNAGDEPCCTNRPNAVGVAVAAGHSA